MTNFSTKLNKRIPNSTISPRDLYRQGVRHVWNTRPANVVNCEWFDPYGPHAMDVADMTIEDIMKVVRRGNCDCLHASREVLPSEVQFYGEGGCILDPVFEGTEETKKYGDILHKIVVNKLIKEHGGVSNYVQRKMIVTGNASLIAKFRGRYRCNLFDPRPLYICSKCKTPTALQSFQANPKVTNAFYDSLEDTPEDQEILKARGTDPLFMLPKSIVGQVSDLRKRRIGIYPDHEIESFLDEYHCEFCGSDIVVMHDPEPHHDQVTPTLVIDPKQVYRKGSQLEELLLESYLDGFDDLTDNIKSRLIEADSLIVAKYLRAIYMPPVKLPCNITRAELKTVIDTYPGLASSGSIPQTPTNAELYTELAAAVSSMSVRIPGHVTVLATSTYPIVTDKFSYTDSREWLIKKPPHTTSADTTTVCIGEFGTTLQSLQSILSEQTAVLSVVIKPDTCHCVQDGDTYHLFPPRVRQPLTVNKAWYTLMQSDYMQTTDGYVVNSTVVETSHTRIVLTTKAKTISQYRVIEDDYVEIELPAPDYTSVFGKWPIFNIYQTKFKLYPKLMSALCIRNINGMVAKSTLMQIAEMYIKQVYNIRGRIYKQTDIPPETLELHVNLCMCYMKSQSSLYSLAMSKSRLMRWAGLLSQIVPIEHTTIKSFASLFMASKLEHIDMTSEMISAVRRFLSHFDVRDYTKVWKKITEYKNYHTLTPLIEYIGQDVPDFIQTKRACNHHSHTCNHKLNKTTKFNCHCCGIPTDGAKHCSCCDPKPSNLAIFAVKKKEGNKPATRLRKPDEEPTEDKTFKKEEVEQAKAKAAITIPAGITKVSATVPDQPVQQRPEYKSSSHQINLPNMAIGRYLIHKNSFIVSVLDVSNPGYDCALETIAHVTMNEINFTRARALTGTMSYLTLDHLESICQYFKINIVVASELGLMAFKYVASDEFGVMAHSSAISAEEEHYYAADIHITEDLICPQLNVKEYSIQDFNNALESFELTIGDYMIKSPQEKFTVDETCKHLLSDFQTHDKQYVYSTMKEKMGVTICYPNNNRVLDLDAGLLYLEPQLEVDNQIAKLCNLATTNIRPTNRITMEAIPNDLHTYYRDLSQNLCATISTIYNAATLQSQLHNVGEFLTVTTRPSRGGYWITMDTKKLKTFDIVYIKHFYSQKQVITAGVVRRKTASSALITIDAILTTNVKLAVSKLSAGSALRRLVAITRMTSDREKIMSLVKTNKEHMFGVAGCGKSYSISREAKDGDIILLKTYGARIAMTEKIKTTSARPRIMSVERFMASHAAYEPSCTVFVDEAKMVGFELLAFIASTAITKVKCYGDTGQIGNIEMVTSTLASPEENLIEIFTKAHNTTHLTESRRVGYPAAKAINEVKPFIGTNDHETKYHYINAKTLEEASQLTKQVNPGAVICMYKITQRKLEKLLEKFNGTIQTAHAGQGPEYDKVVLILHNDGPWGLNGDTDYLTSAMTRAINELTVICVAKATMTDISKVVNDIKYKGTENYHEDYKKLVERVTKLNYNKVPRLKRTAEFRKEMGNLKKIEMVYDVLIKYVEENQPTRFFHNGCNWCVLLESGRLHTVIRNNLGVHYMLLGEKLLKIQVEGCEFPVGKLKKLDHLLWDSRAVSSQQQGNAILSPKAYTRIRLLCWILDMCSRGEIVVQTSIGKLRLVKMFGCTLQSDLLIELDESNYIIVEKDLAFYLGKSMIAVGPLIRPMSNWIQTGRGMPELDTLCTPPSIRFEIWLERLGSVVAGNWYICPVAKRAAVNRSYAKATAELLRSYEDSVYTWNWKPIKLIFHAHGTMFDVNNSRRTATGHGKIKTELDLDDTNVLRTLIQYAISDIDDHLWYIAVNREKYKGMTDQLDNLNLPLAEHQARSTKVWSQLMASASVKRLQRTDNTSDTFWAPQLPAHLMANLRSSYPSLIISSHGNTRETFWAIKLVERFSCLVVGSKNLQQTVVYAGPALDSPYVQNQHYTLLYQLPLEPSLQPIRTYTEMEALVDINNYRTYSKNLQPITSIGAVTTDLSKNKGCVINLGLALMNINTAKLVKLATDHDVYGLIPVKNDEIMEITEEVIVFAGYDKPCAYSNQLQLATRIGQPIQVVDTISLQLTTLSYICGFAVVKVQLVDRPKPFMHLNLTPHTDLINIELPWINNNIPSLLNGEPILTIKKATVSKTLYNRILMKAIGSDKTTSQILNHMRSIATTEVTTDNYIGQRYELTIDIIHATAVMATLEKEAVINKLWLLNQAIKSGAVEASGPMATQLFNLIMNLVGISAEVKDQLLNHTIIQGLTDTVLALPIIKLLESNKAFKAQINDQEQVLMMWSSKSRVINMLPRKKYHGPYTEEVEDTTNFDLTRSIHNLTVKLEELRLRGEVSEKTRLLMSESATDDNLLTSGTERNPVTEFLSWLRPSAPVLKEDTSSINSMSTHESNDLPELSRDTQVGGQENRESEPTDDNSMESFHSAHQSEQDNIQSELDDRPMIEEELYNTARVLTERAVLEQNLNKRLIDQHIPRRFVLASRDKPLDMWISKVNGNIPILDLYNKLNESEMLEKMLLISPMDKTQLKTLKDNLLLAIYYLLTNIDAIDTGKIQIYSHHTIARFLPTTMVGAITYYEYIPLETFLSTRFIPQTVVSNVLHTLQTRVMEMLTDTTECVVDNNNLTVIKLSDNNHIKRGGICVKNLNSLMFRLDKIDGLKRARPPIYPTTLHPTATLLGPAIYSMMAPDNQLTLIPSSADSLSTRIKRISIKETDGELWELDYEQLDNKIVIGKDFMNQSLDKRAVAETAVLSYKIKFNPIVAEYCVRECLIHFGIDDDWVHELPGGLTLLEIMNLLLWNKLNFAICLRHSPKLTPQRCIQMNLFNSRQIKLMLTSNPMPHAVLLSEIVTGPTLQSHLFDLDSTNLMDYTQQQAAYEHRQLLSSGLTKDQESELISIAELHNIQHRINRGQSTQASIQRIGTITIMQYDTQRIRSNLAMLLKTDGNWVMERITTLLVAVDGVAMTSATDITGLIVTLNHDPFTTVKIKLEKQAFEGKYHTDRETEKLMIQSGVITNDAIETEEGQLYVHNYDNRAHHNNDTLHNLMTNANVEKLLVLEKNAIVPLDFVPELNRTYNKAVNRRVIIRGKAKWSVECQTRGLAQLLSIQYGLQRIDTNLLSEDMIMMSETSTYTNSVGVGMVTPSKRTLEDEVSSISDNMIITEIANNAWDKIEDSKWPSIDWRAKFDPNISDKGAIFIEHNKATYLLTKGHNLYKKKPIRGGHLTDDISSHIVNTKTSGTRPGDWWGILDREKLSEVDEEILKDVDISFMEEVNYNYGNPQTVRAHGQMLPEPIKFVATTQSNISGLVSEEMTVEDIELENYDFWINNDLTYRAEKQAPNQPGYLTSKEVGKTEGILVKHTMTPMPAKARPVDTKSLYKDHNTIVGRVINKTKLRHPDKIPDDNEMIATMKQVYCRPDIDNYLADCQANRVTYNSEATKDWIKKHHNAEYVFRELAKFIDLGVLFKQIPDINFHLKIESLLKSTIINNYFNQQPRPIVWQNYFVAAIFSPIFIEIKKRLKLMLNQKFTYADGLTPTQLNQIMSNYKGVTHLFANDLKKQDKQTDEPLITIEMKWYSMLGLDDSVLSVWPVVHDRWTLRSKFGKTHQKSMRTTGQATTAIGNLITNMQCHAEFLQRNRALIVFGLFLGDDNCIGFQAKPRTTKLKEELAVKYNMMATTTLSTQSSEFCCFIVYRRDNGMVGLGPDFIRLKNRFEVTNGTSEIKGEMLHTRKLSYLMMLGGTTEVQVLIEEEKLPINPAMWYDQQELIIACADHYRVSIEWVIDHYTDLILLIKSNEVYEHTWLINMPSKY